MTEVTNAELADLLEEVADDLSSLRALPLRLAASRLREAPSVSDSAGWIEWVPGMPHPFSDQKVDVVLRDGTRLAYTRSSEFEWRDMGQGTIVRYRLSV